MNENNNTNDKQHLKSLALNEDSPFTLDRLPLLLLLRRNYFFSSPKTSHQSVGKTYRPLLVFYSPWKLIISNLPVLYHACSTVQYMRERCHNKPPSVNNL